LIYLPYIHEHARARERKAFDTNEKDTTRLGEPSSASFLFLEKIDDTIDDERVRCARVLPSRTRQKRDDERERERDGNLKNDV